jgi:sulfatase maturation enzyme AslB (radical SAM superfamily)
VATSLRKKIRNQLVKNLGLYVTKENYENLAGPDWPQYDQYLNGAKSSVAKVQDEINNFTKMFVNEGIRFPIKTKTACQSKWTWSTIFLNQLSTASCHRVVPSPFTLEEFDQFHNLPKKIQDRKLMLEGKWPKGGCEYCQTIEEAGGFSDRQHNLGIPDLTPPELELDQSAVYVTPRIVEIFAQNTCNLACTYCNSNLSSKIEQENKKYGHFEKNGVIIPVTTVPTTADAYFEKFINWLKLNIKQLKRLHLLGGETFIQHDLMNAVLDIIERYPNPELQFNVFSNMNVPDNYWDLYTNRIHNLQKHGNIKYFDLTASIDCWGDEAKYARSGLNLEKFESRLSWASKQGDWLRLNVNQTITALTIRTMPELIEKIVYYGKNKHIGQYFEFYIGPQMFQHPNIFSYDMWQEDFVKIFSLMPTKTVEQQEAIVRMEGIDQYLRQSKTHDWKRIEQLKIYLDELDRRRKTDWKKVFPYLDISK